MDKIIRWSDEVPESEFNISFIQGMADRMATSYHKYGTIEESAKRIDWMADLEKRLSLYKETGNREWLMDVANYCMIESTCPQHPESHFRSTDTDESPGRKWMGETRRSSRHIKDF